MPQPQELPHDFRAILRRIQDPKVPKKRPTSYSLSMCSLC
jgi:hypothetical protein